MGEVYRGHNIHNGEPVAIKIVLPSLAHDPKIVALFQKEAMVLSTAVATKPSCAITSSPSTPPSAAPAW